MQTLTLETLLPVFAVSAGTAALAVSLPFLWRMRRGGTAAARAARVAERMAVLHFDGEELTDATAAGRELLREGGGESDWARLRNALESRFPALPADPAQVAPGAARVLAPRDILDNARLLLERPEGGLLRAELVAPGAAGEEIARLRDAVDSAPCLMWATNDEGRVTWANAAYREHARTATGPLFPETGMTGPAAPMRLPLRAKDGGQAWFDCLPPDRPGGIGYAVPVDNAVRAESARRELLQSLTRTFAHLPTGLAIFDAEGRLALFNPALTDLTTLPPGFLAARPALGPFLDALRECRMMPEPRDYQQWRSRICALRDAPGDDVREERWPLPSGRTYRMTARACSDGAVSLQIEDITSEVAIARHYRAEMELGQSVIDSVAQAVAVFGPDGALTLSNRAYAELWGDDPASMIAEISCEEVLRDWESACAPGGPWQRIADFVARRCPRTEWDGRAEFKSGGTLRVHVAPLAGGATLVRFETLDDTGRPARQPEASAGP